MQPADLPPSLQYLAYVVFAILTGIGMFVGYKKKSPPPPAQNNDIILTGAGMVDMNPVRALVQVAEDIRDDQKAMAKDIREIRDQLDEFANEARIEREVKARLAADLNRQKRT
jgi:hypothetical protein